MREGNVLLDYFINNPGRSIHKWIHYFYIYDKVFSRFRGRRELNILEIGIQNGGTYGMWRNYFDGSVLKYVGVDIDPLTAGAQALFPIEIGDQGSSEFWDRFNDKYDNSWDIVIDDGGHHMTQQILSFEMLFPRLVGDGVFLVEDTHTSYMKAYTTNQPLTFVDYAKGLVDKMHAWYLDPNSAESNPMAKTLHSVQFYDSIIVFEKGVKSLPVCLSRGSSGHVENPPYMTPFDLVKKP